MYELYDTLFGAESKDLNSLQMSMRAVIVFLFAIFYLRFTGARAFGRKNTFDVVIVIMLGAIMSRTVTGEVPFIPTIVAGFVFSIMHKIFAMMSFHNHTFGKFIKGSRSQVVRNGKINWKNMEDHNISRLDLMEAVREAGCKELKDVKYAYFERDGNISVILGSKKSPHI